MSKDTPDLSSTPGPAPEAAPTTPTPVEAVEASDPIVPVTPAPAPAPVPVPAARDEALVEDDAVIVDDLVLESVRPSLGARLGAEALGTFFLVLVGLGVALYAQLSGATSLGTALGFGLALIGATIAFGHVSGGHFNPAVTLGSALAGRTAWRDLLPYWLAQIVGGVLASATLFLTIPAKLPTLIAQGAETTSRAFFSETASGYAAHSPLARLTKTVETGAISFELLPVLLVEIIATALLVGVFLGATRRHSKLVVAPFAIGLSYAVLTLVVAPISSGSLNPARATAAAFFSEGWAFGQLWLFWVAPLLGAALAGLAYRAFASDPDEDLLEDDDLVLTEEELVIESTRA